MQTQEIFIAHPTNKDQVKALRSVVKAFKVKFEIRKETIIEDDEPTKEAVLKNIKQGLEEVKLMQQGKLKKTSLKDFLNEL
jgi:hypothetical protein